MKKIGSCPSFFNRIISFLLAAVLCFSCGAVNVFAWTEDDPWTISADGKEATYKNFANFVYYSSGGDMKKSGAGADAYATCATNAGNNSGIVDVSKSYVGYTATQNGTLKVTIKNGLDKTGDHTKDKVAYISRTKTNTIGTASPESEKMGSFVPGYLELGSKEYDKTKVNPVANGSNKTDVSIEVEAGYTYYTILTGSKVYCYSGSFEPYTQVSGSITDNTGNNFDFSAANKYKIEFVTEVQGEKVKKAAVVDQDGNYSIELKKGYTYSVIISGEAAGSCNLETKEVTITDTTAKTENLTLVGVSKYIVSGTITGFPADYTHLDDLKLIFKSEEEGIIDVEADLVKTDSTAITYSASLIAGKPYTLEKTGANDYAFSAPVTVNSEADVTKDASVTAVDTYNASGKFIGLTQKRGVYEDLSVTPTKVTFKNLEDNYTYDAEITDTPGYSISLREGSYISSIECTDGAYSTTTHIVIDKNAMGGGTLSKDLLLKSEKKEEVTLATELLVGEDKPYKTVQAAVDAVANMNRDAANPERVTIKIDPGVYREQVNIVSPNITLESNGGNRDNTKITWYYGIGYKYWSVTGEAFYDPYAEYDKFQKGNIVKNWGATVYTDSKASGFRAKGICFENSFNKYMTDEEIADGAEPNGRESITTVRNKNTNVDSKGATERAAAYVNKADKTEFLDCSFIGSQDTLYTCNVNYDAYYKNCYIEGQTDFIYGSGNVIFDGCELNWCGYDGTEAAGWLTAQSSGSNNIVNEDGYIFRNCIVSGNKERTVIPGYFGRPWGNQAKVRFINTQLESENAYIAAEGWALWNSNDKVIADTVEYLEYNTTYNGKKVDTSGRKGKGEANTSFVKDTMTDTELEAYSVEKVFIDKGWTPAYYTADNNTTPEILTGPAFTSNGDINNPNPGETLTVNYTVTEECVPTEASRISWYAVDTDYVDTSLDTILQKATLLYTTASYKTTKFQIPMECKGKYIMAVVTPMTVGGKMGTPKYIIDIDNPVSDTWINPDNPDEPEPGSGINVYLAGDSTVKDYSANGMYNKGTILDSGSWGEYFQNFFDKSRVTVLNYANGGRSTRNFINEGSLDKIKEKISEGDYLFIQFGHNDCANGKDYYEDRFVPLYAQPNGTDVTADGIYPTVLPTDDLKDASGKFTWNCGATYKGYLQAYINVALDKHAIPVIVSPVSRMYYDSNGKIKTHHDSTAKDYEGTKNYLTSNDAYVTACKQIYEENKDKGVYYLDGFKLTKDLFENAYADGGNATNGNAIMGSKKDSGGNIKVDATHCNKVGGVIEAGLFAKWVKDNDLSISPFVVQPVEVYGENPDHKNIFTIVNKVFEAKDNAYVKSDYWTEFGQQLFDSLSAPTEKVSYTLNGKIIIAGESDLSSKKVQIVDKSGTVIAEKNLEADGSYTVNIESSKDIKDLGYKAKVEGYEAVAITMTAEATPNTYKADDITLQKEPEKVSYTLTGKIILSDGTSTSGKRIQIVDTKGVVVKSEDLNADGSYTAVIESSEDIKDLGYKAKVDGYKPADIVMTLEATNTYKAADIILEKESAEPEKNVYMLSGKTNLTEGEIVIYTPDDNKAVTDSAISINSDGSYEVYIVSDEGIGQIKYMAKVEGYTPVEVVKKVSDDNEKIYIAEDIEFVPEKTPEKPKKGDVTNDGTVDFADASALLQRILNADKKLQIEKDNVEGWFDIADVNGDGSLTAIDVAIILSDALLNDIIN